ncbi:unnamed protein product [Oreochromis niloticus]|nr:unnamed protein product [Mustela putorius furo]
MICWIVLFMMLVSHVHEMSKDPNEALFYQGEENSDVTVEWQFASKVNITISMFKIHCLQLPELKVFFNMDSSSDEPQHEQFAGRVQCDKDALTTGRVRLKLSRVRINDSGRYLCRMATEFGKKVKEFRLNITAAVVKLKPATPKPKAERSERISFITGLVLGAGEVAVLIGLIILTLHCIMKCRRGTT